jgi:hypothetical protein
MLWCLNRFSQPEIWQQMEKTVVGQTLEGPRMDILERLAKEGGLETVLPKELSDWFCDAGSLRYLEGRSVMMALGKMFSDGLYTFVLEPGRIRILHYDDAVKFWKTWWASVQREDAGDRRKK